MIAHDLIPSPHRGLRRSAPSRGLVCVPDSNSISKSLLRGDLIGSPHRCRYPGKISVAPPCSLLYSAGGGTYFPGLLDKVIPPMTGSASGSSFKILPRSLASTVPRMQEASPRAVAVRLRVWYRQPRSCNTRR